MRVRRCLGAVLLLAASAPAMADMYLFDGRAWTAGNHEESRTEPSTALAPAGDRREPVASTPLAESMRLLRMTGESLRNQWWPRHDSNARASSE